MMEIDEKIGEYNEVLISLAFKRLRMKYTL